jgi:acyl-CoA thioesterase II
MSPNELFRVSATAVPNTFTWRPDALMCTPRGSVQGGAVLGAAVAAFESVTGRPVIWATAQYVAYAQGTEPLTLAVELAANGHRTSQARCVARRGDDEIVTVLAALGARDDDLSGTWADRSVVPPPADCPPYVRFVPGAGDLGDLLELRLARGRHPHELDGRPGDGRLALWVRVCAGSGPLGAGELAVIGDMMPLVFGDAAGVATIGNSLDNTYRAGARAEVARDAWVLLDAAADHAEHGIGSGHATLWAEDGTLLARVSQSAILRTFATARPDHPGDVNG